MASPVLDATMGHLSLIIQPESQRARQVLEKLRRPHQSTFAECFDGFRSDMDRIPPAGYASVNPNDNILDDKGYHQARTDYDGYDNGHKQYEKQDLNESFPTPPPIDDDRNIWQRCNSYWVWEISACVLSMACLGIVVWALLYLNNHPLRDWKLNRIRPASFLSIFVTISRAGVLFGVASAIGQLRWLYYLGGSRRLDHLDSFDSATRGPWGAFVFTCMSSIQGLSPTIARFGALITIAALAMDPFTQQILQYPTLPIEYKGDAAAWLLATNTTVRDADDSIFSGTARRQSVYGGLLGFNHTVPFSCPIGNCTWPAFTSMGYDIVCTDVANTINKQCTTGLGSIGNNCSEIRLSRPPLDLSLILQNGSISIDPTSNGTKSYTLLASNSSQPYPLGYKSPVLFNFLIAQLLVGRTDSDGFNAQALRNPSWNITSCEVQYTAWKYENISMINGTFSSYTPRKLDLGPVATSNCWNQQRPTCQEFTPLDAQAVPEGTGSVFFAEIGSSPVQIRNFLSLNSNLSVSADGQTVSDDVVYNLATGLLWNVDIRSTFQNVANTLTDYLRETATPYRVSGTLIQYTTVVVVAWGWFALPAALVVLGAVFLMSVIIYTARGVNGEKLIWKTNTLPLMLHGLEGYRRDGYAGAETTSAIYRRAIGMNVQLRRNEHGEIRFVRT